MRKGRVRDSEGGGREGEREKKKERGERMREFESSNQI